MNTDKIKQEFIEKMDDQETFFRLMAEMELKYGSEWIAKFLAQSKAIKLQYIDVIAKPEKKNLLKDFYNIAFHHSLDRTITREEHIGLIITAYEDYKKKGPWRNQDDIVKKLIQASRPDIGGNNRNRFRHLNNSGK